MDAFSIYDTISPHISTVKSNGEKRTPINQSIIRSHHTCLYVCTHLYIDYRYGRYGNLRILVTPRDGGTPQTDSAQYHWGRTRANCAARHSKISKALTGVTQSPTRHTRLESHSSSASVDTRDTKPISS